MGCTVVPVRPLHNMCYFHVVLVIKVASHQGADSGVQVGHVRRLARREGELDVVEAAESLFPDDGLVARGLVVQGRDRAGASFLRASL